MAIRWKALLIALSLMAANAFAADKLI